MKRTAPRKAKTASRSILWTQDWGTYQDNTLVCVGYKDYEELSKECAKQKCDEWVQAIADLSDRKKYEKTPHFTSWDFKEKSYSVLWLPTWRDDINHYVILAHELMHAMNQVLSEKMDILKEGEAVAYQHGYLFEKILKKLKGEKYWQPK